MESECISRRRARCPLAILCRGWPESWYSWRHQITALAEVGFQVVAPDQRGYGQTDAPQPLESYNILNLAGDIVGLVNYLADTAPIIIGHDWGAPVAWHCALLRPDLFRACGLLSVPYIPQMPIKPSLMWNAIEGNDQTFYQHYFQEPGKAEVDFEADSCEVWELSAHMALEFCPCPRIVVTVPLAYSKERVATLSRNRIFMKIAL
jgi:pimeloyl-ACP methyl ester carboxylesterase